MTPGEAIRQVWPKVRATTPLPTTVAEVRALRDSGFGCPVDDRHRLRVTFSGDRVKVVLFDFGAIPGGGCDEPPAVIRDCTAREFLDLIAEPAQASLFAEAS